ncbi:hypothetical protein P7K49_030850 [Saguinus oedipus]|uniref:Uncharacterized protein n=1 Tax=Saguinus oedipus TaxID=9490 RepID=A0ABQ9U431_SAGOE|nr:hypothetical protein P7K49_030850 [Saguinus oedipus]
MVINKRYIVFDGLKLNPIKGGSLEFGKGNFENQWCSLEEFLEGSDAQLSVASGMSHALQNFSLEDFYLGDNSVCHIIHNDSIKGWGRKGQATPWTTISWELDSLPTLNQTEGRFFNLWLTPKMTWPEDHQKRIPQENSEGTVAVEATKAGEGHLRAEMCSLPSTPYQNRETETQELSYPHKDAKDKNCLLRNAMAKIRLFSFFEKISVVV